MNSIYRHLAMSEDGLSRRVRSIYRLLQKFSIPAPAVVFRPILAVYSGVREIYYFTVRVLVCEPLFKAYCTRFGRNVHTGVYMHWFQGRGRLLVGDNVRVDGKCSFVFATRYVEHPTMSIGSNVTIGHNSSFTVGREITIGNNVLVAGNVEMFDSPGHPVDPVLRQTGHPALPQDVKPIHIGDNAWIGAGAIIYPGVRIGENSIVARGAVVMDSVPPGTIVAGNPARQTMRLGPPQETILKEGEGGGDLMTIRAIICQLLGRPDIQGDDDIYFAGITSIMALPLLVQMEEAFKVTIPDQEFQKARTSRCLAELIGRLRTLGR